MKARLYRSLLFVAYHAALTVGIVTFPLALVTERVGVSLPLGRLVDRLGDAYGRVSER